MGSNKNNGDLTDEQINSHIIKSGVMDKGWSTQTALHSFARDIERAAIARAPQTERMQPLPAQEPIAIADPMPGASGFTMACFNANEVPVGTKLYLAAAAPAQQAIPDLHNAIMNLPCERTLSHFPFKNELLAYKEGHRDARHAAAELVNEAEAAREVTLDAAADKTQQAAKAELARPELTVWHGPMPESNGKSNFTATLKRKGASFFDTDSYTFSQSEYPDRVRYDADCMRYLIGELSERPDILDYDADKHSGYVAPTTSKAAQAAIVSAPEEVRNAAPIISSYDLEKVKSLKYKFVDELIHSGVQYRTCGAISATLNRIIDDSEKVASAALRTTSGKGGA